MLKDYCGVTIIPRPQGIGYEFLVVDAVYKDDPNKRVKMKFPGGASILMDRGDWQVTAARETTEETGLVLRHSKQLSFLQSFVLPGPWGPFDEVFFMAWRSAFRGTLRQVPMDDGKSYLSPPYWVPYPVLVERICPTHSLILPRIEVAIAFPKCLAA